jgi:hypothetical protein
MILLGGVPAGLGFGENTYPKGGDSDTPPSFLGLLLIHPNFSFLDG